MTAPEVIEDLALLPLGAHCISFHADEDEAAVQAASFLSGAPQGQATAYWVPEHSQADLTNDELARRDPDHVGCVAILSHEQVEFVAGHLRPVPEIRAFVGAHPEGVSAGAATLSHYWTPATIPDHLEYESWFQEQPRDHSRFLCPYDLRRIPAHLAPTILRDLGAHHSHVALSHSADPVEELLELFVFSSWSVLPSELLPTFEEALTSGLLVSPTPAEEFHLSDAGELLVQRWSDRIQAQIAARDQEGVGAAA
jgi:hypothetical protein